MTKKRQPKNEIDITDISGGLGNLSVIMAGQQKRKAKKERAKRFRVDGEPGLWSNAEIAFMTTLKQIAPRLPRPLHDYRFHPERKWLFDFAWAEQKIAVEVEGIVGGGDQDRHRSFTGYTEDCWKYSSAAALGWRVLRFTPQMIANDPIKAIDLLCEALAYCPPDELITHPVLIS